MEENNKPQTNEPSTLHEKMKAIWCDRGRVWMCTEDNKLYNRPLEAFPILYDASYEARRKYYIWDEGRSARWPEIDEDIYIDSFYDVQEPNYDNPVWHLLEPYPTVDMAKLARHLKTWKVSLDLFRYGFWAPKPTFIAALEDALKELGYKPVHELLPEDLAKEQEKARLLEAV